MARHRSSASVSFNKEVQWDTVVAVLMVYRDRPAGVLLSYHPPARNIGDAEMTFHTVIADQAAVAVENARLLSHEHDKARLEERQRLARELHDWVTQALFSISRIARSTEVMMQRKQQESDDPHLNVGCRSLAVCAALLPPYGGPAIREEGISDYLRCLPPCDLVEGAEVRAVLPVTWLVRVCSTLVS